MPTYDALGRFWHDYERLNAIEQARFQRARSRFIAALRNWELSGFAGTPQFPAALRVKALAGESKIFEMTWSPDGRCTWEFEDSRLIGKCHVTWRRIGPHAIYDDP